MRDRKNNHIKIRTREKETQDLREKSFNVKKKKHEQTPNNLYYNNKVELLELTRKYFSRKQHS